MNLSIEDLEAIKAIIREVVREELARLDGHRNPAQRQPISEVDTPQESIEQAQEVVARIPRA